MYWDFFVSYTKADTIWAEWVSWQLEEAGYRVLVQSWDMVAGSNWPAMVDDGLQRGRHLVVILSPEYLSSAAAAEEWRAAWVSDQSGAERKIIPVKISPCEPRGLIGNRVFVDLSNLRHSDNDEEDASRRLLDGIRASISGRNKPLRPVPFPERNMIKRPLYPGILPDSPPEIFRFRPAKIRLLGPQANFAVVMVVAGWIASEQEKISEWENAPAWVTDATNKALELGLYLGIFMATIFLLYEFIKGWRGAYYLQIDDEGVLVNHYSGAVRLAWEDLTEVGFYAEETYADKKSNCYLIADYARRSTLPSASKSKESFFQPNYDASLGCTVICNLRHFLVHQKLIQGAIITYTGNYIFSNPPSFVGSEIYHR